LCNKQTIFKPLVLAGGICVDNLEKYWKQNPWGIDISSGVETSPGIKCAVKMEKLFNRVKELREKNESK
jgi:phosphoribosylanthranilate isomerase